MLLCIHLSPFHITCDHSSVHLSVRIYVINCCVTFAVSFLICFCFLESSTGTRSFVLGTAINIMLLI